MSLPIGGMSDTAIHDLTFALFKTDVYIYIMNGIALTTTLH